MRLEASEESQAQRHLFFAERESTKIAGLAKEAVARPLDRIGVVGAGTMGGGIALALAQAGLPLRVRLVREPEVHPTHTEQTPQAYLLARKPTDAG